LVVIVDFATEKDFLFVVSAHALTLVLARVRKRLLLIRKRHKAEVS
jgi:hypothetical protein